MTKNWAPSPVFPCHPIINVKGLVEDIGKLLGAGMVCTDWQLGHTIQKGRALHCIPLHITLTKA